MNTYSNVYYEHLTKIMFNYQIFSVCFMFLALIGSYLSIVAYAFSFLLVFAIIVFTVGLIFVAHPSFLQDWFGGGSYLMTFAEKVVAIFPYFFYVSLGLGIISLVLICLQKNKVSKSRIVTSSVLLGLTVILGIIGICLGGVR